VLDTKNWKEMIAMLAPHVNHWRLIKPDSERALPLELVAAQIQLSGSDIKISVYEGDYDALVRDLVRTGDGETRYVTGSMYMIGRLRNALGVPLKPLWKAVR
jgi:folylpolyglutamate synthase/dihydropteroate synthase